MVKREITLVTAQLSWPGQRAGGTSHMFFFPLWPSLSQTSGITALRKANISPCNLLLVCCWSVFTLFTSCTLICNLLEDTAAVQFRTYKGNCTKLNAFVFHTLRWWMLMLNFKKMWDVATEHKSLVKKEEEKSTVTTRTIDWSRDLSVMQHKRDEFFTFI